MVFLATESIRVTFSRGNPIFNAMPGNPAPLPTSKQRPDSRVYVGAARLALKESKKWVDCISSHPVTEVRLIRRFHSINNS